MVCIVYVWSMCWGNLHQAWDCCDNSWYNCWSVTLLPEQKEQEEEVQRLLLSRVPSRICKGGSQLSSFGRTDFFQFSCFSSFYFSQERSQIYQMISGSTDLQARFGPDSVLGPREGANHTIWWRCCPWLNGGWHNWCLVPCPLWTVWGERSQRHPFCQMIQPV